MKKIFLKIIIRTFIILLLIYLLFVIILFVKQKDMLYFPDKRDFFSCENFTKQQKKIYKNTRFYEIKGKTNNVVIFFHGNTGSACDRISILNILKQTDNNIIFVEYSGYAEKGNSPNIQFILKNVEKMGEYLKTKNYDKVYVMGRSLGTGVASYFAGKFKTDKLLLISPYSQLYKVAQDKYPMFPVKYMFSENYNSEQYLKNYKNDILIIHGEQDSVIPTKFGKELYNGVKNNKKRIILKQTANHHNIFDYENLVKEMILFFK